MCCDRTAEEGYVLRHIAFIFKDGFKDFVGLNLMSVIISIVLCCFFVNMELFSGVLMDCTEKFYARPHYPVTYRPSFEVKSALELFLTS